MRKRHRSRTITCVTLEQNLPWNVALSYGTHIALRAWRPHMGTRGIGARLFLRYRTIHCCAGLKFLLHCSHLGHNAVPSCIHSLSVTSGRAARSCYCRRQIIDAHHLRWLRAAYKARPFCFAISVRAVSCTLAEPPPTSSAGICRSRTWRGTGGQVDVGANLRLAPCAQRFSGYCIFRAPANSRTRPRTE